MRRVLVSISIMAALAFGLGFFGGLQPASAADSYDPTSQACEALTPEQQAANPACSASSKDPITNSDGTNGIIMKIANILAWSAGAIAVIIIIFAGFRMVKSSGDPSKITIARETIIYTLVGLVVIIVARFLVSWVITKFV